MRRLLVCLVVTTACDLGHVDVEDAGPGTNTQSSTACSSVCHGSEGVAAPPRDTAGRTDTTSVGVGAHRAHLSSSKWHKRVECATCHAVPTEIGDPGHIDNELPAEVKLTGLGEGGTWDRAKESCTNTYCHGATLSNSVGPGASGSAGGTAMEPIWTKVDGSQNQCGSCHGAPPPAPHPPGNDCGTCHPTMNPGQGMVIAYPELHIDGHLDVVNTAACDSCHGQNGQSAPPKDTNGNTATNLPGVGAHAAHMAGGTWHAKIDCVECHKVPAGVNDQGHIDTMLPAEITWGPIANSGTYNGSTCANTYCHGGGTSPLKGGSTQSPIWTKVDGTQSQCGSCHGAPPPAPHPTDNNCGNCHPTMNPGGGLVIAYPALHIDGKVDIKNDQPCNSCHGSATSDAPPKDTTGGTTTDLRTVGAHQNHLAPSTWRRDIACSECHKVPGAVTALGHIDTPRPAELTFSAIAGNAAWNGSTCSNTYCHGSTLGGGTSKNPVWTNVNGTQGQCGSCHGAPPPSPHPTDSDCGKCHDTMTAGGGLAITDPARHIDGNLDVNTNQPCNTCHGSATNNAPPKDTQNNTATNTRGVGAHQKHLATANWFKPIACNDCHKVPGTVTSVGHIDTALPAELMLSARGGTTTQWNGSRCSNNYCHGATLGAGGTATAPIWTTVDGSQAQCTSCHGNPPPLPHPQDSNCTSCHTSPMATTHIDGNVDVNTNQACNSCHGGTNNAPPKDTQNGTTTTLRGVGAHQSHVAPTAPFSKTMTCDQCHKVPTATNSVGHIDTPLPAELTFTGIAAGSAWNGSSCTSYCHGSTLAAGGTATAPVWTTVNGSQKQCTSCHGAPPPLPHPATGACNTCHQDAGTGLTIAMPQLHIDGILQVTQVHPSGYSARDKHGYDFDKMGSSTCATSNCHGTALTGGNNGGPSCNGCHNNWQTNCTHCHGGTDNTTGAPPQGTLGATAATDKSVGAHTKHVTQGTMAAAYACSTCHTNPSTALTPGHVDGTGGVVQAEVKYSSLNPAATFNTTTAVCSNLYCHGNGRTAAGTATWTSTAPLTCTSCHLTTTIASGRHDTHINGQNMKCSACHQTVVDNNMGIINKALHVDGLKQVKMPTGTWTPATRACSGLPGGCHGTKTW